MEDTNGPSDERRTGFEARQAAREATRRERKLEHAEEEGESRMEQAIAFLKEFRAIDQHVRTRLDQPLTPHHLNQLATRVQQMRAMLQNATAFLAQYDVRRSQKTLDELQSMLASTREALLPKPKFKFSASSRNRMARTETKTETKVETMKDDEVKPVVKPAPADPLYSFCGRKGETLRREDDLGGHEFSLLSLEDCTVHLYSTMNALFAHSLKGCRVLVGPVAGAVHLEECEDCTFVVASRQVRIHATHNSDFYLHVNSHPIIEFCDGLRFGVYNLSFNNMDEHFTRSGLDRTVNLWDRVQDFRWIKAQQSPHWSLILDKTQNE